MQYILTQEELDKFRKEAKHNERMPSIKKLQEFCTMVADTLPVKGGWWDGKPWGCIITEQKKNPDYEWYCDECPARDICPYDYQHWSQ